MESSFWWMIATLCCIFVIIGFCIWAWFVRHAVIHVFHGWKEFWNKEKGGGGYAVIVHPEKRIEPVFCKFEDVIRIKEKSYIRDPSQIYQFLGLPAMFYNENDSNPIDLVSKDGSGNIERDANFLDSVVLKIKAWAEAKAFKKYEIMFMLIIIIAIIVLLVLVVSGINFFSIDEILQKVQNTVIMAQTSTP